MGIWVGQRDIWGPDGHFSSPLQSPKKVHFGQKSIFWGPDGHLSGTEGHLNARWTFVQKKYFFDIWSHLAQYVPSTLGWAKFQNVPKCTKQGWMSLGLGTKGQLGQPGHLAHERHCVHLKIVLKSKSPVRSSPPRKDILAKSPDFGVKGQRDSWAIRAIWPMRDIVSIWKLSKSRSSVRSSPQKRIFWPIVQILSQVS